MDDIVIIGGGDHAKVVVAVLKALPEFKVLGYVAREDRGALLGAPYLGDDDALPGLLNSGTARSAAMGIGISTSSTVRSALATKVISMGYAFPPIVSKYSVISEGVQISEGVFVNDGATIGPDASLGRFSIINRNCSIDHDSSIGEFTHIAPQAALAGAVKVGGFVNVGLAASIIEYIKIADHAIIGAGAVVVYDCTEAGTYIGVPARKK